MGKVDHLVDRVGRLGRTERRLAMQGRALRFILETRADATLPEVVRAARQSLNPNAVVTHLFQHRHPGDDPEGLRRFFLATVVVAGVGQVAPRRAFDLAYAVRGKARIFLDVQPDLQHALYSSSSPGKGADPEDSNDRAWSLRAMRVPEAWRLASPDGGQALGRGVTIGHPDTGWSMHDDLDADRLDLANARNTMMDSGDAEDHMVSHPVFGHDPWFNPGHGTGTGSVLMSGGGVVDEGIEGGTSPPGKITGVAPCARLLPIKCVDSVVLVGDRPVAAAVDWAVFNKCDVVSISLGGAAGLPLHAAIRDAVKKHVLVVAASGNGVGLVVFPALYPECIAVAATNHDASPWSGTSRGPMITISAPGGGVWRAEKTEIGGPTDAILAGHGTSFATANVAGVAALWVAFHGRQRLIDRYNGIATLQQVFTKVLDRSTPSRPGWNRQMFGYGIIDAHAVLSEPLPEVSAFAPFDPSILATAVGGHQISPQRLTWFEVVRRMFPEVEAHELRHRLATLLATTPGDVDRFVQDYGAELVQLFMQHRDIVHSLATQAVGDIPQLAQQAIETVFAFASDTLRRAANLA